jgi:hypothetical protein
MTAGKNDMGSLLSSIVPKLWSFAFRLARDECVAEQLVQHACTYWIDQQCYKADARSPRIAMLSRIHAAGLGEATPCSQQAPDQHRRCGPRSPGNSADNTDKLKLALLKTQWVMRFSGHAR